MDRYSLEVFESIDDLETLDDHDIGFNCEDVEDGLLEWMESIMLAKALKRSSQKGDDNERQ